MNFRQGRKRSLWLLATALAGVIVGSSSALAGGIGCESQAISDERGAEVTVAGFCFEPNVLRIDAGEMVTWTNEDDAPHLVAGANGAWGIAQQFGRGESVNTRFDEPGVYAYWCPLHPSMLGAVVVEDGAGVVAAAAGSSPADWGALGGAGLAGAALASAGLVVWPKRGSLMSRSG